MVGDNRRFSPEKFMPKSILEKEPFFFPHFWAVLNLLWILTQHMNAALAALTKGVFLCQEFL